ncbi:MAG: AraC family transcriptional regulator [Aphanocapsa sp. GSE-SYN-MK-11-07L]|jgi:AraC-like DNA-binding protein|nr:AraC family transcriptional regulator [Aphanocapsa sp. GSE-SYN-MK-11-07L]
MSITLSQQAFSDLFQEPAIQSHYPDPTDQLDVVYSYPTLLGQGYWRTIQLRAGLEVMIGDLRLHDLMIILDPEEPQDWLSYHFHFSGDHADGYTAVEGGKFSITGIGLAPQRTSDTLPQQPFLEVIVNMQLETFRAFVQDQNGELPTEVRSLIRPVDQLYYARSETATLAMQRTARQILGCAYRGVAKRLYLEGKALELIGLLVAQETEIHDGDPKFAALKPDVVDRIYQARHLLLQRLENPPSIMELAQLVGLNSRTLKEGFRICFGQPVFSYLRDYRLRQAQQLLENQEIQIAEVASSVGFVNGSHFAEVFRKKFGVTPKRYQMQTKKFL